MRSPKYFQDEETPTGGGGAVMTRKIAFCMEHLYRD